MVNTNLIDRKKFTGKELAEMDLKPIEFVVEDLLSVGVHMLAGSPKVGKSWLALWLCLCVANGLDIWGFKCRKGHVLYMCLEDGPTRIKQRLSELPEASADNITFWTDAGCTGEVFEKELEKFLKENPDTKMVVVDTFQKVRGANNEGHLYATDYKEVSRLKSVADKYQIALVLVHHVRKLVSDDPQNMISGTNGIAGAADSTFVLLKHKRSESVATLHCNGRDIETRTLELCFNPYTHLWDKICDSTAEKDSEQVTKIIAEFLSKEKSFKGTATELSKKLANQCGARFAPNSLGKKLFQYRNILSYCGIEYESIRTHEQREIHLTLKENNKNGIDENPNQSTESSIEMYEEKDAFKSETFSLTM